VRYLARCPALKAHEEGGVRRRIEKARSGDYPFMSYDAGGFTRKCDCGATPI